ncbi:hypothetical protein SO802_012157 [Lithocarpus litseifolius]|uniref:non-specific serine/threonine protein kinase n=1 Tax=Lithocarpus litseifolius TaxID=425828 RepID=A0AAW2D7D8_9ROSI
MLVVMMLIERPSILLLLAFLLAQPCILHLTESSNNFTDQSALLAFKSKISFGPNDTVFSAGNWSTTTNFCEWFGVSCSRRRQRVTALNLSYIGIRGTVSPHIGNLSFLISLDLTNNSFYGFLPNEISHLRRLRKLQLSNNLLEGSIPPTIHNCQKLRYFSLEGNKLNGTIPSSLGNMSSLEFLNLETNSFTGPFPLAIFNLSSLMAIFITDNHFSGTLPTDLCSRCPHLQLLNIAYNEFSGKLPSQFNHCTELLKLSLAYNKFDGRITKGFGSLGKLEVLFLGGNYLTGNIPPIISNLSMLQKFAIENNHIEGSIPSDLGRLQHLKTLFFLQNDLTGKIPQNIFNITSLQTLNLYGNSLSGNLPLDTWLSCSNLERLFLNSNKISGPIPSYLSNCSNLIRVELSNNLLSGPIPRNLGNLKYVQLLSLGNNQLTDEPGDQEHSFLSSLTSCRVLEALSLSSNPLNIAIPDVIGNFSVSLKLFNADQCQIKGQIPMGIGSLKNLHILLLNGNILTGTIPSTIGGLESLQRLYLDENKIEGFIPEQLCQIKNLGELSLSNNRISGYIPDCIGNLNLLQRLNFSSNQLSSSIPSNLWSIENLLFLDLSWNSLSGPLSPNLRKDVIEYINLSHNQITGNVPSIIGSFESLRFLDLSKNSFQGDIPQSFGQLKGLDQLDLSNNNLSGEIPKSLEKIPYLMHLNLSFNKLSGEIPSSGHFANFTAESFIGNKALCGNPIFGVLPCTSPSSLGSRVKQILLMYIVPVIASFIIFAALVTMLRRDRQSNMHIPSLSITLPNVDHRMISYQELCHGTNNFCESNLLGTGGFGSVYKAILSDGTIVAVKVLIRQLEGAFRSFDAECKVLRSIRHRNLVKVISTCSNPEFRALVLQYMSNGSLESWLYSHDYCLNLVQKVSIMVDVALALEYLHNGRSESVVHCDLKPSNILLDEDLVAHVGDFGIAKILVENDTTQTQTIGSIGYIAPEYGSEGRVSTKCDIYSYGIILLEIFTRKKPTDKKFVGELNMRQWIASLPDRMQVVDDGLLNIEDGRDVTAMKTILSSILELGLRCSEELPDERLDIKDVVTQVNKIKLAILGNRNNGV